MKNIKVVMLCSLMFITFFANAQSKVASDFLDALNIKQREKANLPFNDFNRETWHYLPAVSFPREGIALFELNEVQRRLAFNFLKSFLSEKGFVKTQKIMDLENVLAQISGNSVYRDPLKYHITIYGNPKTDKTWSWSFEGHHISLNFTVSEEETSFTPRFFGTNPAMIKNGERKGERVLDKEEDLAFELINSMTNKQKDLAIFQTKSFQEIVTGNSSKVNSLKPVGINVESLNNEQQIILFEIIDEYLSSIPTKLAKQRFNTIKKSEFNQIHFGWAGYTDISKAHYYRIQGSSFLIEFDNTQNNANHIHTVWRDFDGDFGRNLIKAHYHNSDHHKQ